MTANRTTRALGFGIAAALFGGAATIGCGGGSANVPPAATTATAGAATASDDDATADLTEHHRYHHHGGVALFIAMSLDTLGISPEQRSAVEKIRTDLHARMEPAHAAEQNLMTTLADGLDASNLEAAKVDAALARVTKEAASLHDADADALDALHAVLTPLQRAALIDKVEAHWAVWQTANASETGRSSRQDQYLASLGADLGLSTDQLDRIRMGLAERMKAAPGRNPEDVATHLHAFAHAFRSDTFDARALATETSANAHLVGWGGTRLARFVEVANPVLTPEQRAKFAQRLREHAKHNPSAEVKP